MHLIPQALVSMKPSLLYYPNRNNIKLFDKNKLAPKNITCTWIYYILHLVFFSTLIFHNSYLIYLTETQILVLLL